MGKTKYRDITLHYVKPKIVVDLFYQDYEGFADYNTPNNDPDPPANGFYNLRPDINISYIKAKGMYVAKGNEYSYRAAYKFVERQRKSAGSFLGISQLYNLRVLGDSAFLPVGIRQNFNEFKDLETYRINGLGIAGGYAHTFVIGKKFCISPLFALGMDIQHQRYTLQNERGERLSLSPMVDLRFSMNYNSDRFFIGLTFVDDITTVHFKDLIANNQYFQINLSVGYRFKAPKILKKVREKLPGS